MYRQLEKNLLNSNASLTCAHNMANLGPVAAEIGSLVWGTPANFNGFRVLASLLQRCRSTEANQCLAVSWAGTLYWGLLPRNEILQGAKFTLHPTTLAFSYIGSVTHWSSGRQPNCGVEQKAPPIFGRAAITLSIGPHSS